MDPEEKALALYRAYRERKTVQPFPVSETEWREIYNAFTSRIVKEEGLCGYKIAFTSPNSLKKYGLDEPAVGVITCGMVDDVSIPFKYSYLEVEVIAEVEDCSPSQDCVKGYYLGLEIPSTRFDAPLGSLGTYQLLADNSIAWRVVKGVRVPSPDLEVKLEVNGEHKGSGRGTYVFGDVNGMISWLAKKVGRFSGLIATGAILGPVQVKPGDRVRVTSQNAELEVVLKG